MATSTILVTGASRGLGRALARALAPAGHTLLTDGRDAASLRAVADDLSAHTRVVAIAGDNADLAHRTALAEAATELGGLDAVDNNASTLGPSPMPALLD